MLRQAYNAVAITLLLCCFALAASPVLQFTVPRAAQRGTEADVVVQGARLSDAKEIAVFAVQRGRDDKYKHSANKIWIWSAAAGRMCSTRSRRFARARQPSTAR